MKYPYQVLIALYSYNSYGFLLEHSQSEIIKKAVSELESEIAALPLQAEKSTQSKSTEHKHLSIFEKAKNLKERCEILKLNHQLNSIKPLKSPESNYLKDISTTFPTNKIKYDLNTNILYCLSAKTGTTNWSKLGAILRRNTTFENYKKEFLKKNGDFVYSDLPNLEVFGNLARLGDHEKVDGSGFTTKYKLNEAFKLLNKYHYDSIGIEADHILEKLFFKENNSILKFAELAPYKLKESIILGRHPFTRLYSSWSHRMQ